MQKKTFDLLPPWLSLSNKPLLPYVSAPLSGFDRGTQGQSSKYGSLLIQRRGEALWCLRRVETKICKKQACPVWLVTVLKMPSEHPVSQNCQRLRVVKQDCWLFTLSCCSQCFQHFSSKFIKVPKNMLNAFDNPDCKDSRNFRTRYTQGYKISTGTCT